MIYFDNAATSFHKPDEVYEAVISAMKTAGNSGRGVNDASLSASRILANTRNKLKTMFHAPSSKNVIFTSGATESLNTAILGLIEDNDHVVTSEVEHNSVLRPLNVLKRKGIKVSYAKSTPSGEITLESIVKELRDDTVVVVLTHASNVLGTINDIEKIGTYLRERNINFIVDASQTAGLYDIDMEKMGISALCFSGHKYMMGAQGIGVLVLNEGIRPKPLKHGGTGVDSYSEYMPDYYPEGLEAGTINLSGVASIQAGLDYIEQYTKFKIKAETGVLVNKFIEFLSSNSHCILYGGRDYLHRTAVVPFNIVGVDSNKVSDILFSRYQISVRAGAHCAPRCHEFLGTVDSGVVRVSFSHFNTAEEVDVLIKALRGIIGE